MKYPNLNGSILAGLASLLPFQQCHRLVLFLTIDDFLEKDLSIFFSLQIVMIFSVKEYV